MDLYTPTYTNAERMAKFPIANADYPEKKRVEKLQRLYYDFASVVDVMLPHGRDKEEVIGYLAKAFNSTCNSILNLEFARIPGRQGAVPTVQLDPGYLEPGGK